MDTNLEDLKTPGESSGSLDYCLDCLSNLNRNLGYVFVSGASKDQSQWVHGPQNFSSMTPKFIILPFIAFLCNNFQKAVGAYEGPELCLLPRIPRGCCKKTQNDTFSSSPASFQRTKTYCK